MKQVCLNFIAEVFPSAETNISIRGYSIVWTGFANVNFVTNTHYVILWAISSIDSTFEKILNANI